MKKIISLLLTIVMIVMCVVSVAAAGNNGNIPTDLVINGLGYIVTQEGEKILLSEAVSRKGDVNFDGKVTAADARLCLQAVASPLGSLQIGVADVNNDGKISAVDARIMLQDVAGMTEIVTYAQTKKGGSLVVGPLRSAGSAQYYWQYDVDKSGLSFFDRIIDDSAPGVIGGPVNQYFIITPASKGTYVINFKLANANQTEVIDEFKCVLTVIEG